MVRIIIGLTETDILLSHLEKTADSAIDVLFNIILAIHMFAIFCFTLFYSFITDKNTLQFFFKKKNDGTYNKTFP